MNRIPRQGAIALMVAAASIVSCKGGNPPEEKPAGASTPAKHQHEAEHKEVPKVIKLSALVIKEARIQTAPVERRRLAATIDLNGQVVPNPDAIAMLGARVNGRVLRVLAREGDSVRAGQVIATVSSPDVARLRAEHAAQRARARAARQNAERLRELVRQRLGAEQDAAAAEAEATATEAGRNAAAVALRGLGVPLDAQGDPSTVTVVTPIAGQLVQRNAAPGQIVGPSHTLATVADLSRAFFQAQVFEKDLAHVREGADAEVRFNGYPEIAFPGRVARIASQVDPGSRTLTARIDLKAGGAKIRLGLFGTARISLADVREEPQIAVPLSAITDIGDHMAVFVRHPDGDFEVHEVRLGPSAGNLVPVLSGLREGEQVVVSGVHTLRSVVLKATMADEEH